MEDFLDAMEYQVAEEQQVLALDFVLKATPARWWETHKEDHTTWAAVQLAMLHQFVFLPKFECQDLSLTHGEVIKFVEQYEGKTSMDNLGVGPSKAGSYRAGQHISLQYLPSILKAPIRNR